jgi:hypothetical protein
MDTQTINLEQLPLEKIQAMAWVETERISISEHNLKLLVSELRRRKLVENKPVDLPSSPDQGSGT